MSDRHRRLAMLFGLAIAIVWVSGCGGDGDDRDAAPTTVVATATVAADTAAERAQALCGATLVNGTPPAVRAAEVVELSGLAASRAHSGVLWGHNDSGDTARAIAFTTAGEPRGVYPIAGAEAIDCEDMTIGRGPVARQDYLYMGDIGDNAAQRAEIVVYRVAEPAALSAGGATLDGAERLVLRYPDKAHDAETLLIDPLSGDLIIVSKEIATGNAGIYRAPAASIAVAGTTVMEKAGEIEKARLTPASAAPETAPALVRGVGYLPTGGDISTDGGLIAIRTYATVWIWARAEGTSIGEALASAPCEAASAVEGQGEAIVFDTDGKGYITIGEGASPPVHHFRSEQ